MTASNQTRIETGDLSEVVVVSTADLSGHYTGLMVVDVSGGMAVVALTVAQAEEVTAALIRATRLQRSRRRHLCPCCDEEQPRHESTCCLAGLVIRAAERITKDAAS